MHNAAFAALGMKNWRYELWDTPADGLAALMARITRDDDIAGCNVTIPHKQAVVTCLGALDVVSREARSIGAVNTLVKTPSFGGPSTLFADNTDWRGVLADWDANNIVVNESTHALVLGAGGSARAVVFALLSRKAQVSLLNRDGARAQRLAAEMADAGNVIALEQLASPAVRTCSLIVNCTSVGMSPTVDASPWPGNVAFPTAAVVYDLIYKPRETLLMKQARAAGLKAVDGLGMLVEQGAAAFAMWTGRKAAEVSPAMRKAVVGQ
jgi:shikimate dehydrogenase